MDDDRYFDLAGLARYSGLSIRTLRRHMKDATNPLPNHHVHGSGKGRGRVLISKREFDQWVASFAPVDQPRKPAPAHAVEDHAARWLRRLTK
ncbi:MAG TPA: hypothetical protein VKE96_31360 [Vicinamibacterales bacterium]|nr:hypothetical protein [Vicinamibacterales bacterium]